jgi:hypothetical protein
MNVHRFDEFVADYFLDYVERTGDQDGADSRTESFGYLIHTYINSPLCYDGFLDDMDGIRPFQFYKLFELLGTVVDHDDVKTISAIKVILNLLPDNLLDEDPREILGWVNLFAWSMNAFKDIPVEWYCQEFKNFASQCRSEEKSVFCAVASRMDETAIRKVRGEVY